MLKSTQLYCVLLEPNCQHTMLNTMTHASEAMTHTISTANSVNMGANKNMENIMQCCR